MSAKLLYNLSDENPNLNKHIGCMNGIFQVFYRQHYPERRVAVTADELKSLPSSGDTNTPMSKKKKGAKEKQRGVSSDSSSRLSFSSSPCSSSFSSADISTTASQFEQIQTETPLREPTNGSPRCDIREFVKSSIHKETRTRDEEANHSEGRRVVKLRDSPRFSYDERETRKTGAKLKETPRLSLDSRSTSFRSTRSSCSTEPQERRTTTSSVVARLMGLEVIPDESTNDQNREREHRFCDSPRPTTRVEADLTRSRSFDSIKKMVPVKAAPLTQEETNATTTTTTTVYGEIQKRLSQLEFKKSEKDLRALQQILEAMEKTQQLMSREDDDDNKTQPIPAATTKNFRSSSVLVKKATVTASVSPRNNVALPNVKVANLREAQRAIPRKQSAMDVTPRPRFYKGQDMDKSAKSQKPCTSPRTQPKKLGFERQSRPTSPNQEQNKIQRQQLTRQQSESASPRRKPGVRSRVLQQSEDRLSDESSDLRSLRSDSTISLGSNLDTEVSSRYKYEGTSDIITEQHTPKQRSPDLGLRTSPKPLKVTVEQPSPVSVLDVPFDEDDSPSPVRKISIAFKDDNSPSSEEGHWMNKPSNLCRSIVWPESDVSLKQPETEHMEEGAEIKNSEHKYIEEILLASGLLRDIDYSMISIQLHQAHLPINPNLFFVLEQNKTSNVNLQDRKHKGREFRQQQTVNLMERSRRKLVFDTVNEILARRFAAEGCTKLISAVAHEKSSRGKELLQTLCSEIDQLQDNSKCILYEDDEELIWEDLQGNGMNWKEIEGETPGLVLDIERLIFKDLICEVVASEVAAFPRMLNGITRQLFHC